MHSTTSRWLAGAGFAAGLIAAATSAFAVDITGAGATFPYPIYAKWADTFKKQTNVSMNYQSIGSGGGIKQIQAKTVDFGASDMPLKPEELEKSGLMQFPAIVGGDVIVYNIKGVDTGKLKLSGPVIADIFLGKITKWNDQEIAKLNAGVNLPGESISVVHRSDGSGTTFIFVNYLSKVSEEWKSKVGEGTSVNWPVGVGGKGNEGVASYVQKINGAIAYVEYAYAKQNKLSVAAMKNKAGEFVLPDDVTFKAAAANAQWEKAPGFYEILTDQAGKTSWPMTGASFILMQKSQEKAENAKQVLSFFEWAFKNGGKAAEELDYVPLPDPLVKLIQADWKANLKDTGGKPIYQ
jgi:phosphate transport system substrate-binding protein